MQFLDIGFGSHVVTGRIVSIVNPGTAPVKRIINKAREENLLVDCTCRRTCQAAIMTDNGQIYLSYLKAKTLMAKAAPDKSGDVAKEA